MIYEFPAATEDIRQGDIFVKLPRITLSLARLVLVTDAEGVTETRGWDEVAKLDKPNEPVQLIVPVRPISAIVISQDCDTQRGESISLCVIEPLTSVTEITEDNAKKPKKFQDQVRRQTQKNLKWFYLPPDDGIGFSEKKAVDFRKIVTVPLVDLYTLRHLRKGRLNHEADEHFRERLSEFFRRYPVDEWYPFTREEFVEYTADDGKGAEPRDWQVPPAP